MKKDYKKVIFFSYNKTKLLIYIKLSVKINIIKMSYPVYYLKKEIGHGSFGRVYLGEDAKTKELYAIKRVDKRQLQQSQYLENAFWKEVDIMKKIKSKYSVRLYNVIPSLHYYNMVEELCDGDLYKELMKRPTGFSIEEVRKISSMMPSHKCKRTK